MSKLDFTVGQKLWYVQSERRGRPGWVVISNIGTKWLSCQYFDEQNSCTYGKLRIDIETLWVDGGGYSSPGQAYVSKEEYEAEYLLNLAWGNFSTAIRNQFRVPNGIDVKQIQRAAGALGIDLKLDQEKDQ
jgi:hypothetical protein